MTADSHFREGPDGVLFMGIHQIPPDMVTQVQFYLKHEPLVFPHQHATKPMTLDCLDLSCDTCGKPVPVELIHGVINDYPTCIEVRFVAPCPLCSSGTPRVLHNVLRVGDDGEMTFQKDGVWVRTTSWWTWLRHRWGF